MHGQSFVTAPARAFPAARIFARVAPAQCLAAFVILHCAVLCALALFTQPTLPLDVVEQLAWANDPQWVYFKHPPLPAWTLALLSGYANHALWPAAIVGPLATGLTLVLVWRLAARILDPLRALLAVLVLEGVIYFNFAALEFNHNIVQMPLWAAIALFAHRAWREDRARDWIGLGIAAWLGLLGKYSTALMLASVLFAALNDPRGRKLFLSTGPWIALLTATALLAPHWLALAHIHFAPFAFPFERSAAPASLRDHILRPIQFLSAQLVDILAALILIGVALMPARERVAAAPCDVGESDRKFVLTISFGPVALSLAMQALSGRGFLDMWGTPMWDFLGLAAFTLAAGWSIPEHALHRFAIAWCAIFALAMVVRGGADVLGPYATHKGDRIHFPARALAAAVEAGWRAQAGADPLETAIGDSWYAGIVSVYAPERPALLIDGAWWKSPWVDRANLRETGAVLVWRADAGAAEPATMAHEFPDAIVERPLVIPYETAAPVAPAHVGWAILLPEALAKARRRGA